MTQPVAQRPAVNLSAAHPRYQWVIVGAVFVILGVTSGLGFYNASVILSAATTELNLSVGSVSGATAMFFAIGGLSGFALSPLLDNTDIRWFYVAGGIVGAVALYGLRWVTSAPTLYIFFALFGAGFGLAGLVPSTTLVTRWFTKRRSVALSIASTGLSFGGIVLTPPVALLITNRGLSEAGGLLAVGWLVGIIPIALLFVRSQPAELSQAVTNTETEAATQVEAGHAGTVKTAELQTANIEDPADEPASFELSFPQARSTRYFRAVCVAYALIYLGQVGALAHVFNLTRERLDTATAATALSAVALSSIVARLVGGVILLRVPTRLMAIVLAVNQAVALLLIGWAASGPSLIAAVALFGASVGNLLMIQPLLMAEAFSPAIYSRVYSLSQLIGTVGVAAGPLILGVLRDAVDYRTAFVFAALSAVVGAVGLALAGRQPKLTAADG